MQDKITGAEAKREMVKSNLPNSSLAKVKHLQDLNGNLFILLNNHQTFVIKLLVFVIRFFANRLYNKN